MKRSWKSIWFVTPVLSVCLLVYLMLPARAANGPAQNGDAARWQIVTNHADASRTLLLDSATGESFILSAAGDTHSWRRIERAK